MLSKDIAPYRNARELTLEQRQEAHMKSMRASMLACGLLFVVLGFSTDALSGPHFVPNSQAFWDFSKNWTTDFGPAYRDTIEKLEKAGALYGRLRPLLPFGTRTVPVRAHQGWALRQL